MFVLGAQTVVVFQQLRFKHVAQRIDDVGLNVVSRDLNFDSRAIEVSGGRQFAVKRDLLLGRAESLGVRGRGDGQSKNNEACYRPH
jgi:hypothetical protein